MRNAARYIAAPIAVFLLLFASIARAMDNPRVDDKAGFFSSDAVSKANETIAQIKRDHKKDLYIETHPKIPDELKSQFQPEQRAQFFQQWADQRAKAMGVDGIIVLISREPSFLQVSAGQDTQRQAFVSQDIQQMRQIMQRNFQARQFDQGLLEGVDYVRSTFAQSLPKRGGASGAAAAPATPNARESSAPPAPAPGPSGQTTPAPTSSPLGGMTSWICIGGAVLIAFFVFRAMRARAQYPQGPYGQQGRYGTPGDPNMPPGQQQYGGYPQAPAGGGMGRGLLGGLLGGALGGYAYDRFMRRPNEGGSQDAGALGGGSGAGGGAIEPPSSSDIGGDFTGSGGDFGDAGGGGDFGGGGDGGGGGGDF